MPVFTMVVRPMRAAVERHVAAGSDVQAKLAASREGAGAMPIRTIRCPNCGFFLLIVIFVLKDSHCSPVNEIGVFKKESDKINSIERGSTYNEKI